MPSIQQLKQAIAVAEKIEGLERQLASILGSRKAITSFIAKEDVGLTPQKASAKTKKAKIGKVKKARRPLSPEALEKIREAQRKRWAKVKKQK